MNFSDTSRLFERNAVPLRNMTGIVRRANLDGPLLGALLLTSGCSDGDGPEVVIQSVLADLSNNKVRTVWDHLPATYQRDVKDLCARLAGKLDPELYARAITVFGRCLTALSDKQEHLIDLLPPSVPLRLVERHLDSSCALIEGLTRGQLATVDGIRNLDFGRLFETIGGPLMKMVDAIGADRGKDLRGFLRSLRVEPVSVSGKRATLRFHSAQHEFSTRLDFVLVGGRWVPTLLSVEWDRAMNEIRDAIAKMPSMKDPKHKEAIRAELTKFESQIHALEGAETSEQFAEILGNPTWERIHQETEESSPSGTAEHPAVTSFRLFRDAVLAGDLAEMKQYMDPELCADFDADELDIETFQFMTKDYATFRTGTFLGRFVIIPTDSAGEDKIRWNMREHDGKWVVTE